MSFKFETITDEIYMKFDRKIWKGKGAALVTPTSLPKNLPIHLSEPRPCVLTNRYKNYAERVKNFKVRSNDTWVITYPKTGTTWTQEMVWLLKNNFDFETAKKTILNERFPCVELCGVIELVDNINTIEIAKNLTSPRFIKSHLPIQLLPDDIWSKNPKIVYVKRNPFDVAVSFYHYLKILHGYSGTMEEHIDCFVRDYSFYSPFFSHVIDFCEAAEKLDNILVLNYEDMKKNLASVIKVTARFLDVSVSESNLKKLEEHLSFESMQGNKSVNLENLVNICMEQSGVTIDCIQNSRFIRKGEVGSWKQELSPELVKKLDDWVKRHEEAIPLIKKYF